MTHLAIGLLFPVALCAAFAGERAAAPAKTTRIVGTAADRDAWDYQLHTLLARARADGRKRAIVLALASQRGRDAATAAADLLRAKGGVVQVNFEQIGYLRAVVPIEQIEALQREPALAAIQIDAGGVHFHDDLAIDPQPSTKTRPRAAPPQARPSAAASRRRLGPAAMRFPSPYVPVDEIGVDRLARHVPNADGRGITVAIVEGMPDLFHPALRRAITPGGLPVDKLAGIVDGEWLPAPTLAQSEDVLWEGRPRRFVTNEASRISSSTGRLVWEGHTILLPATGTFYLARWKRPTRDKQNQPLEYWIAWNDQRQFWMDTNQNGSFRDEHPLSDVNGGFNFARLPESNTSDGSSFVVAFDSDGVAHVYDQEKASDHATMTASTAVGDGLLGGELGGVAPGARYLSVLYGPGKSGVLEALILAATDRRADIISASLSLETFPSISTGFSAQVVDRLIAWSQKPILLGAANHGPATSTVLYAGTAANALSVGAYLSERSLALNFGWPLPSRGSVALFSGRGPANDGGLKPDVLAPYQSIAASPCRIEGVRPLAYELPPCYQLGGGTSNATPFAAGAIARLMSAARSAGIPADAMLINWVVRESARPLERVSLGDQGYGLLRIDGAWELLKAVAQRRVPGPDRIEVSAPVVNGYEAFLGEGRGGPGLYIREGWAVGKRGEQVVTLTRRSGNATGRRYILRWNGNDGTFATSHGSVILARDAPVDLRISIHPTSAGMHTAAIDIVDPRSNAVVARVPCTVVASQPLTRRHAYTFSRRLTVKWPSAERFFVSVPQGTSALKVSLKTRLGSLRLQLRGPQWASSITPQIAGEPDTTRTLMLQAPAPGTWELSIAPPSFLELSADTAAGRQLLDFTIRAQALRAEGHGEAHAEQSGVRTRAAVTFDNTGASIRNATIRAELGVSNTISGVLDNGSSSAEHAIRIKSATTSLRVSLITKPGTSIRPPAVLYLFNCTLSPCKLNSAFPATSDDQAAIVRNPVEGSWKLIIAGHNGANETVVPYQLTITTTHPDLGNVAIDQHSPGDLAPGTHRRATLTIRPIDREGLVVVAELIEASDTGSGAVQRFGRYAEDPTAAGTVVLPLTGFGRLAPSSVPRTHNELR